jgi:uncharacterized protein (TIGR03032 family)
MNKPSTKCSAGFVAWLKANNISLAVSLYRSGRLLMIGTDDTSNLVLHQSEHGDFLSGLDWDQGTQTLWAVSRTELKQFSLGASAFGPNAFAQTAKFPVPDASIHEIKHHNGSFHFAASGNNYIGSITPPNSTVTKWKPAVAYTEDIDTCHVNGFVLVNGALKYATMCSMLPQQFSSLLENAGAVINTETNEVLSGGLTMPHSPRLVGDELYYCHSRALALEKVNVRTGVITKVADLKGFARGLAIYKDFAIVGLSNLNMSLNNPRKWAIEPFNAQYDIDAASAIQVVSLTTGHTLHIFLADFMFGVNMHDIIVLEGLKAPTSVSTVQPFNFMDMPGGNMKIPLPAGGGFIK